MARLLAGALTLSLVATLPAAVAPPVAEAACGTNWESRVIPPPTIKVLRVGKGRVDTVDFRSYVAEVMASGEWPTTMPVAELEMGAVATKQYAWYYALKGHHRSSYRTGSGVCYDVRDDTADQLYRPERADPTPKQRGAVERTWGLSLRKWGRFFLTGYRHGTATRCAADANGWKLFARSVRDCAGRLGWSWDRIAQAYYSPGLGQVWAAGLSGPVASKPVLRVSAPTTFPVGSGTVRWEPATSKVGIARYRLQRRVDGGSWKDVPLDDPLATSARVPLRPDRTHEFRVRARDVKGRVGMWVTGPELVVRLREPESFELIGSGWEMNPVAGATDGSAAVATTLGHRVELDLTGRAVGYLATTGPGRGVARILVNGTEVARVDLRSDVERTRQLVWARNWRTARQRTVAVEVGEPDAPVEVDAFLVVR